MKKILITLFSSLFIFNPGFASEKTALSADEVKALFSGKTWDGVNESKGKEFKGYASPDGKQEVFVVHKQKIKNRYWYVKGDGTHCITKNSEFKKGKCAKIYSVGNGVYQKINEFGVHTHTLKNFVDGKHLPKPKPKEDLDF